MYRAVTILLLLASIYLVQAQVSSCPSLFKRVSGSGFYQTKNPIPQPNVTIDFNTASFSFGFALNTTFFAQGQDTTWVIDFAPFDFRTRALNLPNNCENRLASSYAGVSVANFWKSANHSMQVGALGTTNFLAYGPSNGWNMVPNQCNGVTFSRTFSFNQLLGCQGSNSLPLIGTANWPSTNMLSYRGSLYATAVSPIWRSSAKDAITGYETVEFSYPFEFKFGSLVNDVVAISSTNNFNMRVLNVKLNDENKLVITLRTDLATTTGDFLHKQLVTTAPFAVGMIENVTNVDPSLLDSNGKRKACSLVDGKCYQEWTITSNDVLTTYQGNFGLVWAIAECINGQCNVNDPSPKTVTGTFAVTMDVVEKKVGTGDFKTKLTTYKAPAMTTEFAGPFRAGDRVYVRDQLSVQPADVEKFSIRVTNAWVCFPDDSTFVPKWNPAQNMYGCSRESAKIPAANIIQIINNRIATSDNAVQQSLNTLLHAAKSLAALPYSTTVAFSFLAQALSFQDAIYYIHVETEVLQGGTVRKVNSIMQNAPTYGESGSQSEMNALYVEKLEVVVSTTSPTSPAGTGIPGLYIGLGSGLAGLLGLCCCMAGVVLFVAVIAVRRRKQNKEEDDSNKSSDPEASV